MPGLTAQVDATMLTTPPPAQDSGRPAEKNSQGGGRTGHRARAGVKMVQAGQQRNQPKRQGTFSEFFRKAEFVDKKELESGSRGELPDPRTQAACRALEHADSAPRQSDHDKPLGYSVLVCTDFPNSLAVSTYTVAKVWKDTEANAPEQLSNPLRVVLFQHVLTTTAARLEALESAPAQIENAKKLGWLTEDGAHYVGMKWNPSLKTHEVDPTIQKVPVQVAKACC